MPPEDPPEQSVVDRRQQIVEDLRQEFRAAQQARASAVLERREIPRRLYHYTTLSGLLGITSSNSLWASDVRYMNDASELTYAAELISEVLTETLSNVENKVLRDALPPPHPGFANAFEYGMQPFAACFCEDGDLLSQWRGYRGNETGYALGMDLSFLLSGGLPPNTYLRQVVYKEEEQRNEVREVVEVWLRTAESMLDPKRGLDAAEVFPYPALWALQEALAETSVTSASTRLAKASPSASQNRRDVLWSLSEVSSTARSIPSLAAENVPIVTLSRRDVNACGVPRL